MRPHAESHRERSVEATAIDLPHGRAERAVPVYAEWLRELNGPQ